MNDPASFPYPTSLQSPAALPPSLPPCTASATYVPDGMQGRGGPNRPNWADPAVVKGGRACAFFSPARTQQVEGGGVGSGGTLCGFDVLGCRKDELCSLGRGDVGPLGCRKDKMRFVRCDGVGGIGLCMVQ